MPAKDDAPQKKSRLEAKIANLTAIIDTREQLPLDLRWRSGECLKSIRRKLDTGDYSIEGFEDRLTVERKSVPDLVGCIGKGRDRFERELERMLKIPSRCVVVEGHWADLEVGNYPGLVNRNAAVGSVLGWIARGIPFIFAGNRVRASEYVARLLVHGAKNVNVPVFLDTEKSG